ncbi:MAG: hypothetical protein HY367_03335, partial [Candidatus Aenigmarchaeota archaeon]|nr:hypothetical protein [Candidatus Aenigmarchaeota archaeon]
SESRVIVIDTITPFLVINRTELNLTILRNDSGLLINISVNDTNRNNTGVLVQGNGSSPVNVSFTLIAGSTYQVNTTPGAMGCNIDSNCTLRFFGRDLALNTNATETLSIGVDNTNPAVSGAITNVSIVRNASSLSVNVTVTDGYSISTVLVGNNSNVSMTSVGGNVFQTNTTSTALGCPANSNCTLTFYANDTANNRNQTATLITLLVDNTNPALSVTFPTSNTGLSLSRINITGTASDINNGTGDATANVTVNDSAVFGANVGSYGSWNFSNISIVDGAYSVNVTVTDAANNSNTTTVSFTIDDIPPSAVTTTSPSPANSTNVTRNYITVNATFTDANPSWCIVEFGNSTGTVNLTNTTGATSCLVNVTGQSVGSFNYTVIVNDTAGAYNRSGMLFGAFRPDIEVTGIAFATDSLSNHALAGSNMTVNVTILVNSSFDVNATLINLTLFWDGTLAASASNTSALSAGSLQNVTFPVINSSAFVISGNRTIIVTADYNNNATEANETNNNLTRYLVIGYNVNVTAVSNQTIVPNSTVTINITANFSNGDPVTDLNSSNITVIELYGGVNSSRSITAFNGGGSSIGSYAFNLTVQSVNSTGDAQFGINNITVEVENASFAGNATTSYNITAPRLVLSFGNVDTALDLASDTTDDFSVSLLNAGNAGLSDVWINITTSSGGVTFSVSRCGPITAAAGTTNSTACSSVVTYTTEGTKSIVASANGTYASFLFNDTETSSSVSITNSQDNSTSSGGSNTGGGGSNTLTCSTDANCPSTQICANSVCATLVCPSGQNVENHQCVSTASDVVISAFEPDIDVVLGDSVIAHVSVKNQGTDTATANLRVDIDVNYSINPASCNLLVDQECTFDVSLATDNGTAIGEHQGTLEVFTTSDPTLKSTESFVLNVLPSAEKEAEINQTLGNLESQFNAILGDFNSLVSSGGASEENRTRMELLINETQSTISQIEDAIMSGDFVTANTLLADLQLKISRLRSDLEQIRGGGGFNIGFWVMIGVIVAGVVGFLVYMMLPPKDVRKPSILHRPGMMPPQPPGPAGMKPGTQVIPAPPQPAKLAGQRFIRAPNIQSEMAYRKSAELFYREAPRLQPKEQAYKAATPLRLPVSRQGERDYIEIRPPLETRAPEVPPGPPAVGAAGRLDFLKNITKIFKRKPKEAYAGGNNPST